MFDIEKIENELWQLHKDCQHFSDLRDLKRMQSRQSELLSCIGRAERKLWYVLDGFCEELAKLDTLVVYGLPQALTTLFGLLPEGVCVWPKYPYGNHETSKELVVFPPLEDPYCPIAKVGLERDHWHDTAFLPCSARMADLLSIFPDGDVSGSGGSREEFSAWVGRISQVLQRISWIGFHVQEEPGFFVTFWPVHGRSILDGVIDSLHNNQVAYGAARMEEEELTWTDYGDLYSGD